MKKQDFIFFLRLPVLAMIRIYQMTLSFDHGPMRAFFPYGYCRYHPTCSEYSYRAIAKYGLVKGSFLTTRRVLRCTPFHKGGVDEVPS